MSNIIEKYIDCCIINGSHYDVALACVEVLKTNYRYIGNNLWEYIDDLHQWHVDEKQAKLKHDIKTKVCNAFVERALYWENMSSVDHDINLSIDAKFRSNKLLIISSKLKDDKYILTIIKESKQFFIS